MAAPSEARNLRDTRPARAASRLITAAASPPTFSRSRTLETKLTPKHAETPARSEEHTSELQSLMRISYAVFCLKTKTNTTTYISITLHIIHNDITTQTNPLCQARKPHNIQ